MSRTITNLNSLLDTRRLVRKIKVDTDKNIRQTSRNLSKTQGKGIRTRNAENDKIRNSNEQVHADSKENIKVLQYIAVILKTHLKDSTNLHSKIYNQTIDLLDQNIDLEKKAEMIMEHFTVSTQTDTPLNTVTKDLVKKLSKDFKVEVKTLTKREDIYKVITIESALSEDRLHCIIASDGLKHRYKTYINEVPVEVDTETFNTFLAPSQAYKEVTRILQQDGLA